MWPSAYSSATLTLNFWCFELKTAEPVIAWTEIIHFMTALWTLIGQVMTDESRFSKTTGYKFAWPPDLILDSRFVVIFCLHYYCCRAKHSCQFWLFHVLCSGMPEPRGHLPSRHVARRQRNVTRLRLRINLDLYWAPDYIHLHNMNSWFVNAKVNVLYCRSYQLTYSISGRRTVLNRKQCKALKCEDLCGIGPRYCF